MLNRARQAGAGDIDGRAGTLQFGTVVAKTFVAIRIHVPVLPVLAIVVHGEECSVNEGRGNVFNELRFEPDETPGKPTFGHCETWHGSDRGKSRREAPRH